VLEPDWDVVKTIGFVPGRTEPRRANRLVVTLADDRVVELDVAPDLANVETGHGYGENIKLWGPSPDFRGLLWHLTHYPWIVRFEQEDGRPVRARFLWNRLNEENPR
jgi:hypothetical protein